MIGHFSCGATSAIACAMMLKADPTAEIIYADVGAEHPDNKRFMADCEQKLFKKPVKVLVNDKGENLYEFLAREKCIAFAHGAPCTTKLKKLVIRNYLGLRMIEEQNWFGFDAGEPSRIARFMKNNHDLKIRLPLFENGLTKANCLALLMRFDIKIPEMYNLGYSHSNCIGCVKAQNLGYWTAIRQDFPDIFKWFAVHERNIGRAINRRKDIPLYLDEWPDDIKPERNLEISCGYSCGAVGDYIEREDAKDLEDLDPIFGWLK